jgi:excisionase family DNA binding protein
MKLLDITQLSNILNVKPKTIYDWVHKRKIPYYKVVGSLRFDYDEVERWIRSKKHKARGRVDIL